MNCNLRILYNVMFVASKNLQILSQLVGCSDFMKMFSPGMKIRTWF